MYERIGNYQIIRKLSEGGMGVVYEARHLQLDRRAAVKVLFPFYAHQPEFAQRLLNEARAANLVEHPGIVEVFEVGQLPDQSLFIAMELLKGESLRRRLENCRRLSPVAAVRLGRHIAAALIAAHQKGIIHRDLKPENIMLVPDPDVPGRERTKLLDFGIAKLAPEHGGQGVKTATGMALGTPVYMSPEQCLGAGGLTGQTDVYSLGVTLYEVLAGAPPFSAVGQGAVMLLHMTAAPRRLTELDPKIPPPLAELVHRMLAKDPAARPTVAEVERQLTEIALAASAEQEALKVAETQIFTRGRPRRAVSRHSTLGGATAQRLPRPWRRGVAIAGGLGLLLLVALGMLWARSGAESPHPDADAPAPVAAAAIAGPGARIRWTVQTEPPGASVLHIESGKVLGKTPLTVERVPEAGQAVLLLSHEGCADQQLILAKDRSVTVSERLKTLRPSAAAPRAGSEAPRSEGRSDGSRRSSERSPRPSEPAAAEPSHTQQPRIVD